MNNETVASRPARGLDPDRLQSVPPALDSIKKGSTAVCVVCHVKEGTNKPETVSETINYKGKTYAFCNESEKAEFISEPKKYAGE